MLQYFNFSVDWTTVNSQFRFSLFVLWFIWFHFIFSSHNDLFKSELTGEQVTFVLQDFSLVTETEETLQGIQALISNYKVN